MIPKAPGYTDMTIHDTGGKPRITYFVRVTREDVGLVMSQLEQLLGNIEGVEIKAVGGTIIIDGEIILPKDMIRIFRVVDAMKDRDPKKKAVPIKNIATISKVTMAVLAKSIEKEIGSPEISVRVLNNNIVIEGTAQSNFEADRAVKVAKLYLPELFVEKTKGEGGEVKPKKEGGAGGVPTIIDLLTVAPRPAAAPANDIKITMNYVELNNEYEKVFSFRWKPLVTDSSSVRFDSGLGGLASSIIATISSLFPKLNTARSRQLARILKQEQIIVKDGARQPAAIESAINFFIQSSGPQGQGTLTPIEVQNITKVRAASIPGSDSIELGIQITLNSVLGLSQGAPIIAKNSLQTQITIKNGDSAALGGFAVDRALSGYNRQPTPSIPGQPQEQGEASPLFNLERSKQYIHGKQQYVIFVTPEILRTASAGTEDITRKFRLQAGD